MSTFKILSLPVVDEHKQCLGFVDALDVASFIIESMPTAEFNGDNMVEAFGKQLKEARVREIVDRSGRNPYEAVAATCFMDVVVPVFAKGVHRVPLVDNRGEMVAMLTQSAVIKYLAKHIGALKEFGQLTVVCQACRY